MLLSSWWSQWPSRRPGVGHGHSSPPWWPQRRSTFSSRSPYGSFRISRQADVTTEALFVVVGLLVGELAARGRRHRADAAMGRHEIARLHDLSQRIAEGEDPDFVLIAVASELRELLESAGLPVRARPALRKGGLDCE